MLSPSAPADTQPRAAPARARATSEADKALELAQPPAVQPMDTQRPHDDNLDANMRGGRSAACPGRFCFIIPCPIPCDFCFI